MAKKPKPDPKLDYPNFCKAFVDDGSLHWEYRVGNNHAVGRQGHDEDVSGWTESDIIKLSRQMLGLNEDASVEVIYC